MTEILEVTLPRDESGNDPNDFRDDEGYRRRILENAVAKQNSPNMDWTEKFIMSEAEADKIDDPEWIFENLIIRGHLIAIPAPPNGGKTTILMWIAGEISKCFDVYYVNADISGTDAKQAVYHAKAKGFTLMLPDMQAGLSMDDVVTKLEEMNEFKADYSSMVFVFDTLKKMTDVINKAASKRLYKVLRGLTAKGMTVILLAHTNKYNDADGKPIYEGTGDLRSDVDELIYMLPKNNEDGSMTVSTDPDKKRAEFKPITFTITKDRRVIPNEDYIDVATAKQVQRQREKDETVIEAISEAIQGGKSKQMEITAHCKEGYSIGWRTVDKVLNRYRMPPMMLWSREKAFEKNAWIYHLEG